MPVLLSSLGTSRAIVPEAFLLPGVSFEEVHVLTTASIPEAGISFIQQWFAQHAPQVALSVTRAAGFKNFESEQEHFLFEEVLYRWMLERAGTRNAWVCLTGGFKTMSAAMQRAAAVMGAAQVFHVLVDAGYKDSTGRSVQPDTPEQIEEARAGGYLRYIRLGPESGWPQLRQETSAGFPLTVECEAGGVRRVTAPDEGFRMRLQEIVERSHRIADAWDRLPDLPFAALAAWSAPDLTWLGERLNPDHPGDREWVSSLPKVELHCHLGGCATHGPELENVRAAAVNPERLSSKPAPAPPPGWPQPDTPVTLTQYMQLGDATGTALLGDSGCLRRQCELLYEALIRENIRYAEIRCSPGNYADEPAGRSPWRVLCEIREHFQNLMEAHPAEDEPGAPACRVNLILIATRRTRGDFRAAISRHLSLAVTAAEHWREPGTCCVAGVDLAGFEDPKTRAHYFREEFTGIHRCGLALTVHAGENDDAEAVWSAVFDLNARRLGHALHLVESRELMSSVAARGIGVEMCPYANWQIKGFHPMAPDPATGLPRDTYPLKRYLDEGIRVTVNTDNPGISGAGLTDNLLLAVRMCPELTRMDVLRLLAHAADTAFLQPKERLNLSARLAAGIKPPRRLNPALFSDA